MDLSIIIVSWNVEKKIKENLRALFKSQGDFSLEVFVVDNDSSDNTVEMIKENFPQVKLIANQENLGFSKANNQALKLSQGSFFLLLNPDMIVKEDALNNMLNWMKNNQQAAIAGCKLVDENNNIIKHVRRFPTLVDQLAVVLKIPHFFPKILNKYLCFDFDYNKARKVDSIRGSFFMFKKSVVDKIGCLDENFFIWFEEVDFCKRAQAAGLETWYTPAAVCLDYVGQSFNQVKISKKQKYFRTSMLYYFKKWHSSFSYCILFLAWFLAFFLVFFRKLSFFNKNK